MTEYFCNNCGKTFEATNYSESVFCPHCGKMDRFRPTVEQMTKDKIYELLRDAAAQMTSLIRDPGDWGEWLTFALEVFETEACDPYDEIGALPGAKERYETALSALKREIEVRLETGHWESEYYTQDGI